MALITWNDSFSVQVAEIDRQHQKLVAMINDLDAAMRQGKGKDTLAQIIAGLAAYAGIHFRTEERYFEQFGYAESDSHKQEHANFSRTVADFKSRFDQGAIGLSIEVMNFLSTWLQQHIKTVDKHYGSFFNEHGLH
jgi:hemerythrin